jgi:hypothetical protein
MTISIFRRNAGEREWRIGGFWDLLFSIPPTRMPTRVRRISSTMRRTVEWLLSPDTSSTPANLHREV